MTEQQAVVKDAETPAEPGVEVEKRTDVDPVDALLAQYDQETKKPDSPTATETPPKDDQRIRNLEAIAEQWQQDQNRKAVSEVVKSIRGDIPEDVFDDDWVDIWLNAEAKKDPRLATAFLQRGQNPKQWAKIEAGLRGKLAEKYSKLPDKAATEDRELVAQSVRGASTPATAQPAPKLGSMSNAQYRKHVIDEYGFDPGV